MCAAVWAGYATSSPCALRQRVHAGAGREVLRRLGAAVQHHDEPAHARRGRGRHVEAVVARAGGAGDGCGTRTRRRAAPAPSASGADAGARSSPAPRAPRAARAAPRRAGAGAAGRRAGRLDRLRVLGEEVAGAPPVARRGGLRGVLGQRAQRLADQPRRLGDVVRARRCRRAAHRRGKVHVHRGRSFGGSRRQWMRPASALPTSGLACSAPSTVIEAMVSRASSGVTSAAIRARPEDADVQGLAGGPDRLELGGASSRAGRPRACAARSSAPRPPGMGGQLVADRRADEVGAIRAEALLHHQVDAAEVDVAEVDGDLLAVGAALPELSHVVLHDPASHRYILRDGTWMVGGWAQGRRRRNSCEPVDRPARRARREGEKRGEAAARNGRDATC